MADVFVSYARSDKARVAPLVAAIEARGWTVWWDPEIDAGQQFDDQIEAELLAAAAVVVVWTATSVSSRWVRGEAREAAEAISMLKSATALSARLSQRVWLCRTLSEGLAVFEMEPRDKASLEFLNLTQALYPMLPIKKTW